MTNDLTLAQKRDRALLFQELKSWNLVKCDGPCVVHSETTGENDG